MSDDAASSILNSSLGTLDTVNAEPQPRSKRRRDLLKHYGIQEKQASLSSKEDLNNPLDIDSKHFNIESFLAKLLKENALTELIRRDNSLVSEIQQLDGDMKTLVYENYNKFISATDTVRSMKSQVQEMEKQVELLSKKTFEITDGASSINSYLDEKRGRIHELSNVHNVINKLNFILELPLKLRNYVKNQQYVSAVVDLNRTSSLLARYQHLPAFKKIHEECDAILQEIKKMLNERLYIKHANHQSAFTSNANANTVTLEKISEAVGLDLGLLITNPVDLSVNYLSLTLSYFKKWIQKEPIQLTHTIQQFSSQGNDIQPLLDSILKFQSDFLTELANFILYYDGYFLSTREYIQSFDNIDESRVYNIFWTKLPFETRYQTLKKLNECVLEIESEFFEFIKSLFSTWNSKLKTKEPLLGILSQLQKETLQHQVFANTVQTQLHVNEFIDSSLNDFIQSHYYKIQNEFLSKCANILLKQVAILPQLEEIINWFKKSIHDLASNEFQVLLKNTNLFAKELPMNDTICINFEVFLKNLHHEMINCDEWNKKQLPMIALCMSRILLDLSGEALESIWLDFKQTTSPDKSIDKIGEQVKIHELSNSFKQSSQTLASKFVESEAASIYMELKAFFDSTDWISKSSVDQVSSIWKSVTNKLYKLNEKTGELFTDAYSRDSMGSTSHFGPMKGSDNQRRKSVSTSKAFTKSSSQSPTKSPLKSIVSEPPSTQFDAFLSNLDRLFEERLVYFSPIELQKSSIMTNLCKVIIKSFIEVVRMYYTLSKSGFQQIQLDTEYIRLEWTFFISDKSMMNSLLNQVLESAYKRSNQPIPMENHLIESLVSK